MNIEYAYTHITHKLKLITGSFFPSKDSYSFYRFFFFFGHHRVAKLLPRVCFRMNNNILYYLYVYFSEHCSSLFPDSNELIYFLLRAWGWREWPPHMPICRMSSKRMCCRWRLVGNNECPVSNSSDFFFLFALFVPAPLHSTSPSHSVSSYIFMCMRVTWTLFRNWKVAQINQCIFLL